MALKGIFWQISENWPQMRKFTIFCRNGNPRTRVLFQNPRPRVHSPTFCTGGPKSAARIRTVVCRIGRLFLCRCLFPTRRSALPARPPQCPSWSPSGPLLGARVGPQCKRSPSGPWNDPPWARGSDHLAIRRFQKTGGHWPEGGCPGACSFPVAIPGPGPRSTLQKTRTCG